MGWLSTALQIVLSLFGLGNKAADAAKQTNDQATGATLQRGADTKAVADVEQAEITAGVNARAGGTTSKLLHDGDA